MTLPAFCVRWETLLFRVKRKFDIPSFAESAYKHLFDECPAFLEVLHFNDSHLLTSTAKPY